MSVSGSTRHVDVLDEVSRKAFAVALGEELRRAREAKGWSRAEFVARLPSGIGERTLLAYEHGLRQLTALRLVELCQELEVEAPTVLIRGLQRALLYLDTMPLHIDLHALLCNSRLGGPYKQLAQWARNVLVEHPDGVVEIEPVVVRNFAQFFDCTHRELAAYLARFTPADDKEQEA